MQTIKFRSPHYTLTGDKFSHFSYWGQIDHTGKHSPDCFCSPSKDNTTYRKEDEQFIGLKDSKGTEVFEGDIIKFKVQRKTRAWGRDWFEGESKWMHGEVFYWDGGFAIKNINGYEDVRKAFCFGNRIIISRDNISGEGQTIYSGFEVVGNIHENAALLNMVIPCND